MSRLIGLREAAVMLTIAISGSSPGRTLLVPEDFRQIQDAIDAASNGDTVLVDEGTYAEPIRFRGKAILVSSIDHRSWGAVMATVISPPAEHTGVEFTGGEDFRSELRGITIENGTGRDFGWETRGGGVVCLDSSPTLTHCNIVANSAEIGGGIFAENSHASLVRCRLSGNTAGRLGGGIDAQGSGLTLSGCVFKENSAPSGGALHTHLCGFEITNCIFVANQATGGKGAGVYSVSSPIRLVNCTFVDNRATDKGGGVFSAGYPDVTIENTIVWGNGLEPLAGRLGAVTYSDVHGGWPGRGNISLPPRFTRVRCLNHVLGIGSPCIDTGNPTMGDGTPWPTFYRNSQLLSDIGAYGGPGSRVWLTTGG